MKKSKVLLLISGLLFSWPALSDSTAMRSALIIGLSQYAASSGAATLEGVSHDMESAKRMATAMGIPDSQIRFVRDQNATKDNILSEIQLLSERSREGGRTFIYFSGHGTRYWDPTVNGCVEGLLSHDGQAITNAELAKATQKITAGADKVITMIDACHSGGLTSNSMASRSLGGAGFKPKFSYKTASPTDVCSQPSNMKTRGLLAEATRLGVLQENVVQITSSRPDEVSFDEASKGGLATQGIRDCLLGKAADKDGSGAVSLAEIQQCAQAFIDSRLKGFKDLSPHHITVTGNRNLIPVALQRPVPTRPAVTTPQPTPTANLAATPVPNDAVTPLVAAPSPPQPLTTTPQPTPAANLAATPSSNHVVTALVTAPSPPRPVATTMPAISATANKPPTAVAMAQVVQPAPAPATVFPPTEPMLASLATLTDIEQQRDPRIILDVKLNKTSLKIGKDALDFSIKSSHDGYIYLVLLGSDRKSFYVLYPNGLDNDNRIKAGQTRKLPRPDWQLQAAGPPGLNHLLVMVSSSPRQIDRLTMAEPNATNPFTFALNEIGGRAALINFLIHNKEGNSSERFGAKLLTVKEVL
jgi:hypothetical protein